MKYNIFNLPSYVKFNEYIPSRGGARYVNTTYLYRADGTKLKKQYSYKDGPNLYLATKITEYIDGFQYERNATLANPNASSLLKFLPTSEGYYDFQNNTYIYNYVDHLGNTRISFKREGNIAVIVKISDYYAFGLKHNTTIDSSDGNYKYEYNGKEIQEELDMYDYGARFYMPDLGRWGVVDPLAEVTPHLSPYHYGNNNPIMYNDPTG
ncbi:MAG: RHS repeat-associated core domain-containing protein, partial [Pedobacter sp.]